MDTRMLSTEAESQIQTLIGRMTLEEKVGQLHQMGPTTSSTLAGYEVNVDDLLTEFLEGRMSEADFQEKIGHCEESLNEEDILNGRLGNFIGLYEPEKIQKVQEIAAKQSRLKIPLLVGADIIRGYRTIFPTPLAQSCSWNMDQIREAASIAAKEAYVCGIRWVFGPMVDIARDGRWGRIVESPGEDPYLASQIARASVYGFQGDEAGEILPEEKIAACMKHFAAYGAVSGGQDYNTVDMSLPTLFNIYLPPFQAAAEAGAASAMTAFHDLNGVPCTMDAWLIQDVLRKKLNFKGMVVSDAEAVIQCVAHGAAEDMADATLKAIMAGNDMDMSSKCNSTCLAGLVREGKVPVERLDEAVANVLRLKYRCGLFHREDRYDPKKAEAILLCEEHREASRALARESMVLLENPGNILPFSKKLRRVAVIGALAADAENFHGPWAFAGGRAEETVTILQGIREALGSECQVEYSYGCHVQPEAKTGDPRDEDAMIDEAAALAKESDAVVIVAGENLFMSGEAASRAYLELTGRQKELICRVCAAGKPVAVVLVNGRPLEIGWMKALPCALLEAWHPGTEGGRAVADLLFGDANPSGHLSVTFANTAGQEPMYYNHPSTGKPGGKFKFTSKYQDVPVEPLYPFGYGKSYTDFEYSNLRIEVLCQGAKVSESTAAGAFSGNEGAPQPRAGLEDVLRVSLTVKNVGSRAGADVVQLYVRDVTASMVRPVKELKGFKKLWLEAGESRECIFELPVKELGFYNRELEYVVEPGRFLLWVGQDCTGGLEGEFVVE